jgi:hypothetical protein
MKSKALAKVLLNIILLALGVGFLWSSFGWKAGVGAAALALFVVRPN